MIHEYSHLFIKYSNKTTHTLTSYAVEEGSCDLFADLVINHYLEKHHQIQLGERRVRIDYPYSVYSSYDFENAWQRTIIDKNSIYARRNYILPMFEIQNHLRETNTYILDGNSYYAEDVAKKYFGNRKIYEIPRKEMFEFYKLYSAQINPKNYKKTVVRNFDKYFDNEIQELTSEEIFNKSFQILDTTLAMIDKNIKLGKDTEIILQSLIEREINLVYENQPVNESIKKYIRLIPDYLKTIDENKNDENKFFIDAVKDLQFAYLEQMVRELDDKKSEEILLALNDSNTRKIFNNLKRNIKQTQSKELTDIEPTI